MTSFTRGRRIQGTVPSGGLTPMPMRALRPPLSIPLSTAVATLVAGLLCALTAAPANAELVVFADGGWLRVEHFQVDGDRAWLGLPGGGGMTVDLSRIAQVVDDEVDRTPPVEPEPDGRPRWRFSDDEAVPDTPFGQQIWEAARRHGVASTLVAAVVRAESAFDAGAVSAKGARGLMQLMPATASRFGVSRNEIHDPEKNLDAGTRYLAWLLARFDGDVMLALAAYNAGEGTVDRYDGVPPYRETRNYLRRIYATLGFAAG